jgi:hypothetical protein
MKTFWILAGVAVVLYVIFKRLTLTFTSDIPAVRQIAKLPFSVNVSDLLGRTSGEEIKVLRVKVSL